MLLPRRKARLFPRDTASAPYLLAALHIDFRGRLNFLNRNSSFEIIGPISSCRGYDVRSRMARKGPGNRRAAGAHILRLRQIDANIAFGLYSRHQRDPRISRMSPDYHICEDQAIHLYFRLSSINVSMAHAALFCNGDPHAANLRSIFRARPPQNCTQASTQ